MLSFSKQIILSNYQITFTVLVQNSLALNVANTGFPSWLKTNTDYLQIVSGPGASVRQ